MSLPMSRGPSLPTSRRAFLQQSAAVLSVALIAELAGAPANAVATAPGAAAVPIRSLHPYPNKIIWGQGLLRLGERVTLRLGGAAEPAVERVLKETWRQFTFGALPLEVIRDRDLPGAQFRLSSTSRPASPLHRETTASYALRVDEAGATASAQDFTALRHAWFTLLQLLQATDSGLPDQPGFTLAHVEIQDGPCLAFRGIHLCVFKETSPLMLEKAIRLAAFLKYSHVVLEFWGMLKLDTLKELAWPEAWTKASAGRLVTLARDLGLDVVPHPSPHARAAAARVRRVERVRRARKVLSHRLRRSLPHATSDRCRTTDRLQLFTDHVNRLDAHLEKRGRRALMWGDALLERAKWPRPLEANGTPALPTHESIPGLSRRIVIADWHYNVYSGDLATLRYFRDQGFATFACPYNTPANIRTLAKAAVKHGSEGLLLTTWHHLVQTIPQLPVVAAHTWGQDPRVFELRQMHSELLRATTAAYLRKLVPANGQFDRAGWNPFELPAETN